MRRGSKIVVPSTPADAKGLLKSAIRDNNPVLYFEHKLLYATKGEVPEDPDYLVPLGKAAIPREGDALTLVAISAMVPKAIAVADRLAKEGHHIEVIDPRSLNPFDRPAIINSVKKTGKIVVAEESYKTLGVGAEIGAMLMEEALEYLDRRLKRVAIPDVPIPTSPVLEKFVIPSVEGIYNACRELRPGRMPFVIQMPKLGHTMTEGTVLKWHKREGDSIRLGEVILAVETDKAEVEVESPTAGVLKRQIAGEGEVVQVGEPLGEITREGEAPTASAPRAAPAAARNATPQARRRSRPGLRRLRAGA